MVGPWGWNLKICSLLPSGTEILYALGLEDRIIGVTDLCTYPPEVRAKPIVSRSKIDTASMSSDAVEAMMRRLQQTGESPYDLDVAWLQEQRPDVVLTQDLCYFCEVDAATVNRAVETMARQPQVLVLNPRSLADIFDTILRVGRACQALPQAERLVGELQERVQAVRAAVSAAARRPRVFSLEGINPLVIGGHWIPEMLQVAGGQQDIYPPGCPAARLPWSVVRDCAPEKLFIDLCSSDLRRHLGEIPWLAEQEGWQDIPAVRSGEVYLIDHVYFSTPGPRVALGLEMLAQLTHPELVSGLIPPGTVLKLDPIEAVNCPAPEIARCFHPYPPLSAGIGGKGRG